MAGAAVELDDVRFQYEDMDMSFDLAVPAGELTALEAEGLLAVCIQHVCKSIFLVCIDHVSGCKSLSCVHTHIQRSIVHERKTTIRIVKVR